MVSGRTVKLKSVNWMEIISPQHQAQNWVSIKLKSINFLSKQCTVVVNHTISMPHGTAV